MSWSLIFNLIVKYNNFIRIYFVVWWVINKLNEELREVERYISVLIEFCDDRIICLMRLKDVYCLYLFYGVFILFL